MEQRVMKVVESCLPRDGIKVFLEADIMKDLGFDSLDMLMLWSELEQEFGVAIQNEDLKGIKTVNDIVQNINKLQEMER